MGKNVSRLNFETRWKDEILKSLDVPQEEITQVRSEGWGRNKKWMRTQTRFPAAVHLPAWQHAAGDKEEKILSHLPCVERLSWEDFFRQRDVRRYWGQFLGNIYFFPWPKRGKLWSLTLLPDSFAVFSPPFSAFVWCLELQQPLSDCKVTSLRNKGNTNDDETRGCKGPTSLLR